MTMGGHMYSINSNGDNNLDDVIHYLYLEDEGEKGNMSNCGADNLSIAVKINWIAI